MNETACDFAPPTRPLAYLTVNCKLITENR